MTDKPFITPQDISLLARPCYADEAKVLAYIYEAEQNNIKPKIGDDLFLRLKDGENPLLLDGGTYEKNGKRYQLNGIKKALAYYAYSRLLESGSVDLTRQGVVNRRSDAANAADEDNIIKISRETYAIADRYMQEIMDYLGVGEAETTTTQRTSVRLIGASGGASRSARQQQTSLGAIDPNKYATKEYVDGKIAALDFPEVDDFETKEDAEKKLQEAKDYTDEAVGNIDIPELPELAKVAKSGDYNDLRNKPAIPSLDGYATKQYVDDKIKEIEIPDIDPSILECKQDKLVSGENIKTINGKSILGKGDLVIEGKQGEKGEKGDQGNSGYTGAANELELVNNLTQGGATAALSAEQGKAINDIIRADLLIDGENLFNGIIKTGAPWPGFVSQNYIEILTEALTKYSVNLGVNEIPQYKFVAFFDEQDTFLSNMARTYSDGKMNFTTPENCVKVRITVSNISSFENCYIVKGDDPNTFVPSKYLKLYEQRKEADARYAEITSLLDTKISAKKCLNKTYFSQKKYGAPWSGYASCYYYDIPRELFNDVLFLWEMAGTKLYSSNLIIRLIDNDGTLFDSGFNVLKVYLQYDICRIQIAAENIKTIRLVMYNWSDAQINNLFIGSDKDADYTSWNWVKLRTVPPVSGEPYYGVNEDLTKIVGTPSSDDVVFKKISSVNLLNVEDHIITGAATVAPYNPLYWSNYITVDAETLYTLSIDGMVSNYGFTTHFYDSNKTLLESTNDTRHITPANCAFVRISLTGYSSVGSVDGTEHWQYQKGEVTVYESYYQYVNNDIKTALSGKRFAVIGDSFTAGGVWFSRMCAKLGAFNKHNAAISGARWSDTAEPACAYKQAQSIVANGISMDYILCVLGVNDYSNDIPLGDVVYSDDISSMNLSTITGGIQACVAYLRNNMPNAVIKIGYTPAGQFYNQSYPNLSSIIERMKEIALLYGIDYIETRCLGVSRFISNQSDFWENGMGGGHPAGQGYNIIGDGMARLILSNM